ncbi:chromatin associated protein KTI12 [Vararia minispora EC-137]|uniref:Chromatin associated protein KTI12 n=1 Tax=Vararia minispora EC-137 TaxID=1314806 RepID=A0ACB8QAT2_9AGAM|nr:chromatin associated protein KTI12 [Vararia minispora EC-137]
MALITISGYPCSGKSTRTALLKEDLERRIQDPSYSGPVRKVVVLSDDLLGIQRSAYDDSRSEKPARGILFTALQRALASDAFVIIDSLNYIKGFRYQMYCAARELKMRVCTVHVLTRPEQCRAWNAARVDGKAYLHETLENLFMRFEEPSSMVRWDSPLFTVVWDDPSLPLNDIWASLTEGSLKSPNAGTQAVPKAPTDALYTLEHTVTSIVSAVMSAQAESGGMGGSTLLVLPSASTLRVQILLPTRALALAELQRLKRQFVTVHKKAITLGTVEKGIVDWSEEAIANKFVSYLQENLRM